jgi:hypothetical protein
MKIMMRPSLCLSWLMGMCLVSAFFSIYGVPALISILTFRNDTVCCGFSTFAHFFIKDELTNGVCISCFSKRQPLKANL